MAFVVEVAAGPVVVVTATGGNVGRADAGAMVGSCMGGCALETCAAGGAVLAVLGAPVELLQATQPLRTSGTRRSRLASVRPARSGGSYFSSDLALAPKRCTRRTRAAGAGVLDLPGDVQDDAHPSIGIFDKSVGRLHVQGLTEGLCDRQSGLTSIAKDAHDPAGFDHYPRSPSR